MGQNLVTWPYLAPCKLGNVVCILRGHMPSQNLGFLTSREIEEKGTGENWQFLP